MSATGVLSGLAHNHKIRLLVGRPSIKAITWVWCHLPPSARDSKLGRRHGRLLHRLVLLRDGGHRYQNPGTYFMRNRAELAFLGRLAGTIPQNAPFNIAILGCSIGAEAYSMAWAVRSQRPDIKLAVHASDISESNIATARSAVYQPNIKAITGNEAPGLDDNEREQLFEPIADGKFRVREAWRAPISFHVLDAMRTDIIECVGLQDLVVANRFLCHMEPDIARLCLRNVIKLVKPGGHLLVSGVDLDVRSQLIREAGLVPVIGCIEDLHDGDPTIRMGWPLNYWGLEPLDKSFADWPYRYAAALFKPAGRGEFDPQSSGRACQDGVVAGNAVAQNNWSSANDARRSP